MRFNYKEFKFCDVASYFWQNLFHIIQSYLSVPFSATYLLECPCMGAEVLPAISCYNLDIWFCRCLKSAILSDLLHLTLREEVTENFGRTRWLVIRGNISGGEKEENSPANRIFWSTSSEFVPVAARKKNKWAVKVA